MLPRWLAALALLLAACGGAAGPEAGALRTSAASGIPLGWWGISRHDIREAPGALAVVTGGSVAEAELAIDDATSAGRQVWLMLWPLIQRDGRLLADGWQSTVDAIVASRGHRVRCWYIADEPHSYGYTTAQLDELTRRLPTGSCIVMSVDPSQVAAANVPPRVSAIAVNAYSAQGITPAQVRQLLDQAYAITGAVYLSLETYQPGPCAAVTPEGVRRAQDLNRAMTEWAAGRNVLAAVGFLWRSEPDKLCGARDIPAMRSPLE